MKEFRGRVAVVTGAASGIGRALAECFAREGMKLVLADVEPQALEEARRDLAGAGVEVLAHRTDVASAADVDELARAATKAYGTVHVVCNNAGVALSGPVWEHTLEDWQWVLGVNLWGVIHGIRTFVPLMLANGGEGHIVNTASVAGLVTSPSLGVYNVTKHAVVTLSETLHLDLAAQGAPIKVSVLCPAWVNTRIMDADRNRPSALLNDPAKAIVRPERAQLEEMVRGLVAAGLSPAHVADRVLDAIRAERFYVLPHPEMKEFVRMRMEDILQDRNPTATAFA